MFRKKNHTPNVFIRQYQKQGGKKSFKAPLLVLLVLVLVALGILGYQYKDLWLKNAPQQIAASVKKDYITIYCPVKTGKLEEKKIDVSNNLSDQQKAEQILANMKTLGILPQTTTLYDMAVNSDGVLYLNFSRDIFMGKVSSKNDILKTFSIVNSFLATFRNAGKVQLLTDGEPIYTTGGTVYTYKPIEFNNDLLED